MNNLKRFITGLLLATVLIQHQAYANLLFFTNETLVNDGEEYQIGGDDDASTTPITLEFGSTNTETLTWNLTRFELSNDLYISGGLEATGVINFSAASQFRMREDADPNANAACTSVYELIMNTTTGNLMKCTATGTPGTWVNAAGATTFNDLATRVKELVFTAEYQNYSLEPDGSANRGKMETAFVDDGGSAKRNYYEWTTQQGTLNDMDIALSFRLPNDFDSFTGSPLEVTYQTSDGVTTTNRVDVELYDTTGTAVSLTGGSALASGSWTTANITFGGSPTFTAGSTVTLKLKLSATSAGFARVSDVVFNYNGR